MTKQAGVKAVVALTYAVLGVVAPATALAFRAGPLPGLTGSIASGGATCMQCHGAGAGAGSVQIVGLPSGYEADEVYDLIIRVSDPSQAGAGFQISVEDAVGTHVGTLSVTDAANTQLNPADNNFVNHTSAGVDNAVANWGGLGNAAEYPVRWQAPAGDIGPITFWAAGNAINSDFTFLGDIIYLTDQTLAFSAGGVPTVSEWGILFMALVMITTASVMLRRRAILAVPS